MPTCQKAQWMEGDDLVGLRVMVGMADLEELILEQTECLILELDMS